MFLYLEKNLFCDLPIIYRNWDVHSEMQTWTASNSPPLISNAEVYYGDGLSICLFLGFVTSNYSNFHFDVDYSLPSSSLTVHYGQLHHILISLMILKWCLLQSVQVGVVLVLVEDRVSKILFFFAREVNSN